MNSEEINAFWDFERQWFTAAREQGQHERPLLIKDIFQYFVQGYLSPKRNDWDNMSEDTFYIDTDDVTLEVEKWMTERAKNPKEMNDAEREAHKSFDHCFEACKSLPVSECFQFMYRGGICSTGRAFRLGKPVPKIRSKKRSISGWDMDKIRQWVADQGECKYAYWPELDG